MSDYYSARRDSSTDVIRPPNVSRFTHFFSSFLSIHRAQQPPMDGHQMYFGVSVVGKALTIGIEISPTIP